MQYLNITSFRNKKLLEHAKTLSHQGCIKLSPEKLLYLDIDDRYIHDLCPMLDDPNIEKPDYFSMGIGSHISVIYPNEFHQSIFKVGMNTTFEINNLFRAETNEKIYFALTVNSPELLKIREMNQLDKKLNLNGYIVDMHTTIGVIRKNN